MNTNQNAWDYVPFWQVFPFNLIKKPFFSAIWYSSLVYTIWDPKETLPTILGIIFFLLSFTRVRFFLSMFSFAPCIATMIISRKVFYDYKPNIILVVGIVWLIFYAISMYVTRCLSKEKYIILPVSNKMAKNPMYNFIK